MYVYMYVHNYNTYTYMYLQGWIEGVRVVIVSEEDDSLVAILRPTDIIPYHTMEWNGIYKKVDGIIMLIQYMYIHVFVSF